MLEQNWLIWVGVAAAIVLLIAGLPLLMERARPRMGEVARAGAEGEFASLSQGVTHYRWIGPVRGPVIVMVHGLAAPMEGLIPLAEALGQMGYRVLVYDLYGRGLSDAPEGKHDRVFFLRQLKDLLAFLDIDEEVTLVGYSMGGAIATAFAADYPHRITRLILIATTGVVMRETGFGKFTRKRGLIGSWLHGLTARDRINKTIPLEDIRPSVSRVLVAQRQELKRRGFLPGLLSSRRGMAAEVQEKEHRIMSKLSVPVVAVWGEKDEVIPAEAVSILARWNRKAHQGVVPEAGHGLPYTHTDEVIATIRQGLRG